MNEWHMIAAVAAATVAVFGTVLTVIRVAYKLGERKGEANTDRKLFKDSTGEVKEFMNEVKEYVNENRERTDCILKRLTSSPAVEGNSALKPTELGKKISKILSIGYWTADHAAHLVKLVSEKQEFEIFELCKEYVPGQFQEDSDFQRKIRKGAYEIDTNVEHEKMVYEVELRDTLLAHQSLQLSINSLASQVKWLEKDLK